MGRRALRAHAASGPPLLLGDLDLPADLTRELFRSVDVDVRLPCFEGVLDATGDHCLARLTALARNAEGDQHVAGFARLPEVDVRLQCLARQVRERELPREMHLAGLGLDRRSRERPGRGR